MFARSSKLSNTKSLFRTSGNNVASATGNPDLRARRFLLFAIFLSQLANITSVKPLIAVAGIAALILAVLVNTPPRNFFLRGGLMGLTLLAGLFVFLQYGRLIGRESGVALLFIFGPLKLIEAKSTRDFMVVWGLGLMLFVASFFENLGLFAALTVAPIIVIYIAALRLFDAPNEECDAPNLWSHVKTAGLHTLMGIPLAAMLFILFPRATAPLWGMRGPTTGQTGRSEERRVGKEC